MTNSYTSGNNLGKRLKRLGLTALLAGGTALAAQAQLIYDPTLSTSTTGTYTDLGANGTVITTANTDDANSAAQNIGFTFTFNSTAFTQFVLNTNGLMRLGASAPSSALAASPYSSVPEAGPVNSTDAADVNLIMPFNFDLTAGTSTPEYRVYTTGTAGSRICTIQWKNVSDKAIATSTTSSALAPTQYANFSFQVKLYEGTNQIDFVYGAATAGTGADGAKFANVGLKGSDNLAGDNIITNKASVTAWSGTTFTTGPQPSAMNAHNFRGTIGPDAGRTYHFLAPVANDAAVYTIYTLGKLPTAALPHIVQAFIVNSGTATLTNQSVTLTVSGANTFTSTQTIASLASGYGTTVAFTALPATLAAGINNVTVTVPADGNNTNNSATVQQTVSAAAASTFSYIPSDQTNVSGSKVVGTDIAGGIYATKFTTQKATTVTSVNVYLGDAGATASSSTAVGKTVYGVVLSSTGAILGQSASYVIQTADLNAYKTFTINTPPSITAGSSFFVGLAQAAYTGLRSYPIVIQSEVLTRSDAYFTVPLAGGTPTDVSIANPNFGRLMMEANVTVVLATSKELQRAVTVYPNPSESGIFNLNVQNANAIGGLGVEVTNQLGQRVFAGSARDNFTTQLDLSNLAAGIYHLQVRNGQDYTSSQISIVK